MNGRTAGRISAILGLALVALGTSVAPAEEPARSPLERPEFPALVRLHVPGRAGLDAMENAGFDLTGGLTRVPSGFEVDALVTPEQRRALTRFGARILAPGQGFRWPDPAESQRRADALLADLDRPAFVLDSVKIGRVDSFTTKGQGFISVEAKSTQGSTPQLILLWDAGEGTVVGTGGRAVMSAFVDSGVYMYHRILTPVDARPSQVMVVSTFGSTATGYPSDWLYPVEALIHGEGYRSDFIDGYKDPTQLYARLEQIAEEYPDITEVVTLPHTTNGYRRKAQATMGSGNSAVVVSSTAWGHEGGNDITVELAAPQGGAPLGVTIDGNAITVQLATGSTAQQVIAALNAEAGDLVTAHTYRGNTGTGAVAATGPVALTDFLQAPPSVSREPFPVRALRIGKEPRDEPRTGVLVIAQDHAREWVTPLVALEAAERLVQNAATDPETQRIIEEVDVFIVPSNNPDGSHYSRHDFSSQRRNMTNHCGEVDSDPGRRNSWGVDLNRNYRVGSGYDGYSGASTSCISNTYLGPGKLSEPESQNVIGLVEQYPNIKFFMTIHSNGGQLFWQPGAYIAEGRITTPRPEMRDEAYYWQMAERILSHVKAYQDTPVRPDNVGGSADVLYSSAGNVREDLYNNYGVYAFGWEIGGSVWNPDTGSWQSGSFQPAWPQAHGEMMEYASGVVEMFRIAADHGDDQEPATTSIVPGEGTYAGPVDVRFQMSEPATIYYTIDGSRPTFASSRYRTSGIREDGEALPVAQTTTFKWFSVDPAGNIEGGYDPDGQDEGYRQATITISGPQPAPRVSRR